PGQAGHRLAGGRQEGAGLHRHWRRLATVDEAVIALAHELRHQAHRLRAHGGRDGGNRSPTTTSRNFSSTDIFGSLAASVGLACSNQSAGSWKWLSTSRMRILSLPVRES